MGVLTRFSLKNPIVVFLLSLLVIIGGVMSAFSLKEELMPDIAFPVIAVVTPYPGASPEAVATDVSEPLEHALRNISGVTTVNSTSVQNVSEITLQLAMNADLNSVQQKVQQVVAGVHLPSATLTPTVQKFSFNSSPVVNFTVASKTASNTELRTIVNQTMVPALQGIPGVADVQTGGAAQPRVNIQFHPDKLSSHNLTLQQVIQDLKATNVTMPLGSETVNGQASPLQFTSPFSSLAQIRSIPIPLPVNPAAGLQDVGQGMQILSSAGGEIGKGVARISQGLSAVHTRPKASTSTASNTTLNTVPLSDLATVTLAPPANGSINRTNGQPSVLIGVVKTEDANTVQMAKAVERELATLQKQLPSGVNIVPLFDSSTMVVASVNGMLREAILGALFAALVILLFLRNWRTTVIAVVSIPLSLLIALMLLNRFHITLNIMTLGGMAVATGRVVDDSIVVIENIFRAWKRGLGFGKSFVQLVTREVGHAITSSTITTVAVFLPLGFVSGVVGKIFIPFAVTVVCSLLSSLLVALTVVPALAWLFVARYKERSLDYDWLPGVEQDDAVHPSLQTGARNPHMAENVRPWQQKYQNFLRGALNHKGWVLGVTLVIFLASLAVLPFAGSTFIPASKEKFATVSITMPVGTPRSGTDAKAKQVEGILQGFRTTVTQWNTKVGSDLGELNMSGGVSGDNQANLFLQLQPSANVDPFISDLRAKAGPISAPATIQVKSLVMGGSTGGFAVTVTSPNAAHIKTAATLITAALQNVPGLANVNNNLSDTRVQLNVIPNLYRAAKYGLMPYQIANAVSAYVQGQSIGHATINGEARAVWVSLTPRNPLTSLMNVKNLPIDTPVGKTVTLSDVASVSMSDAPVQIERQDGQPYATVSADFTTQNTGSISRLAMQKLDSLHLPSDVQVQVGGDTQEMTQSFQDLIKAILISVGLVYLVMLMAFGEWSAPFSILFSMPVVGRRRDWRTGNFNHSHPRDCSRDVRVASHSCAPS